MKRLVSEGNSTKHWFSALAIAAALSATNASVNADTFDWVGTLNSSSTWHTAAIWSNRGGGAATIPNLAGDVAVIRSSYGHQTLNVGAMATVGTLESGTDYGTGYVWGSWLITSGTSGATLRFANNGQNARLTPVQGASLHLGANTATPLEVELVDPLEILKTSAFSCGVNFNARIRGGTTAARKPILLRCSSDQYTTLTVSLLNADNSFTGDVIVDADARPDKTRLRLGKVGSLNGSDAMLGNAANALILRNGGSAYATALNSSASYSLGRTLRGTGRFAVRSEDQWGGGLVRRTLNVDANGVLSPGEGTDLGALTIYANVVLGSAATTRIKLTPAVGDQLVLDATSLTLGGTLELLPASPELQLPVGTSWTIATTPAGTTSSFSGSFASITPGFSVSTTGSQASGYSIVVTSIPLTIDTLYWDANGGSSGTGGSGIWDATSALWRNGSSTGTLQPWSGYSRAVLGGTAGTVALNNSSQDIHANRISLTTSGYTVAAPSSGTARLVLAGTTPLIEINQYCSGTISAVIAGGALTKNGAGMLALRGDNTYSQGTVHTAGGLTIGHANALGTGTLHLNGGSLSAYAGLSGQVANPVVVNSNFGFSNNNFPGYGASLVLSGPVALTGPRQISVTILDLTLNGVVSDNGNGYGLTYVSGSYGNSLTLGGANTFSGGLTYNANANGILNLGHPGALGTGTFTINGSGGKINNTTGADDMLSSDVAQVWNGNFTYLGARSLHLGYGPVSLGTAAGSGRTVTVSANTLTVGGVISNGTTADSLTKAGGGTLALEGVNTYDGGTLVSAGALSVEAGGCLGTGPVTVAPGALLVVQQDGAIADDATVTLQRSGSSYGRVQVYSLVVEYVGAVVLDGASYSQPGTSFGAVGTGSTVESDIYFLGGGQLVITPAAGPPDSPYVPAGYQNVFREEFDGTHLRLENWWTRYIYSNGMLDTLNDERQKYRENGNHIMTGSTLQLTARLAPTSDPRFQYESGMIRSKTTFKYGYYEARLKVPAGLGVWPAFWLNSDALPDGSTYWPPEIDIMEFAHNIQDDKSNMVHMTAHGSADPYGKQVLFRDPGFIGNYYHAPFDFPDDYHVFGLLWDTDDTLTWYVDGKKLFKITYNWVYANGQEAAYAHVLLNLGIGGSWAGRYGIDDTAFPQAMEVDYVRVYQKPDQIRMGRSTIGRDLLVYPDEVVVDNSAGTGVQITGSWTASTGTSGYWGSNYLHDGNTGKGSKSVRFTPTLPAGDFQVSIRHTAGSNRASNVPVDIVHADGTDYLSVDQRSENAQWITLGTYRFTAGAAGSVLVGNSGTDGYVIADAVRFTPLEAEGYAPLSSTILIY